jgi:hypothetical protein
MLSNATDCPHVDPAFVYIPCGNGAYFSWADLAMVTDGKDTNESDTVGAAEVTELKDKTFLAVLASDVPEGTKIIPRSLFTKKKTDTAMAHCGQPATYQKFPAPTCSHRLCSTDNVHRAYHGPLRQIEPTTAAMPAAAHRQRPGFELATRTTRPDFYQMLSAPMQTLTSTPTLSTSPRL